MVVNYAGGIVAETGGVLIVLLVAGFLHQWMANQVGKARSRLGVAYPNAYALAGMVKRVPFGKKTGELLANDTEAGKQQNTLTQEEADEFNRYQRVHQNNVEVLATFYVLMLIAGFGWPVATTAFGALWIVGRFIFAMGYYRGVQARQWGGIPAFFATLALVALSIGTIVKVIQGS